MKFYTTEKNLICSVCNYELFGGAPLVCYEGKPCCTECAFLLGLITDQELMKCAPGMSEMFKPAICNGKVLWFPKNQKFPWERTSRKRNYAAYEYWRKQVFERDKYTCQSCGKRGGELNAHHIKPYAKYKELRTEINNGITLCLECHRAIHKKKRGEDLSQSEECLQKQ